MLAAPTLVPRALLSPTMALGSAYQRHPLTCTSACRVPVSPSVSCAQLCTVSRAVPGCLPCQGALCPRAWMPLLLCVAMASSPVLG